LWYLKVFLRHVLDTFPYTFLKEDIYESRIYLFATNHQEENEAICPLLAMLKKVLHPAATIVVFAALAAIALQVLCTEAYADSGILILKVCHRCFGVSTPACRKN
jgi:hypothetical protein